MDVIQMNITGLFKRSALRSPISMNYGSVLGMILLVNFIVVCVFIKSFGASWDEIAINEYSHNLLQVYRNLAYNEPYQSLIVYHDLHYYGPAYWIIVNLAAGPLLAIFPLIDAFDVFHLMNFAAFLAGVWILYCLLRRFYSPQTSFAASLLYLAQPLLWGHGVINPKDTPFATLILATIFFGLRMVDEHNNTPLDQKQRWKFWEGKRKYLISFLLIVVFLLAVDLLFNHFISQPLVTEVITHVYSSKPGDILHIIMQITPSIWAKKPLTAWIDKSLHLLNFIEVTFILLVASAAFLNWFARTNKRNRLLIVASVIAGLTISTRVLGPAAIGPVALYAVLKLRRQSIIPIIRYLAVTVIVAYISWPYLWGDPVNHFLESLLLMTNFPYRGFVRFEGIDLSVSNLPWYYLPKLLAIQLTLPAVVLAGSGIGISIKKIIRKDPNWEYILISMLWFFIPVAWVVLIHPVIYDNFRQFLFILPPLFFFASLPLQEIFQRISKLIWKAVVYGAIVLPGVLAGIWLHPYQYVYYNALVGWTAGAGRNYEGDYWLTSFCEAARYMDETAPEGSRIAFTEGIGISIFNRCHVKEFDAVLENADGSAMYSLLSSRSNSDLKYYQKMQAVEVIGRGASVFSVVKQLQP